MKSMLIIAPLASLGFAAASAAPVTYALSKDHTDVTFTISHADFTLKHGSFADVDGTLKLDVDHLEDSSVAITVAVNSIYTQHAKRDHDLQGTQFLDAVQFPTMQFVSTKVTTTGPSNLDIAGNLTLHGVTKGIVLHTKVNKIGKSPFGNVETAGFTATGVLKRSDFGIKEGIPMIGDDVTLAIDAEFAVPRAQ